MRIVFMGSPDAAAVTLRNILRSPPLEVVGVVTQPDRPAGRRRKMTSCPCKAYAQEMSAGPIITPERVNNPEVLDRIEALKPDVIVVVAFGQLLCRRLLDMAPHGCVNGHFSLLPKYRGAAPVQAAVAAGDKVSGVTIMQLDDGMDEGDILLKAEEPIYSDDTGESYMERLAILGAVAMVKALRMMDRGELKGTPQDHSAATYAPKMKKEHGLINWEDSAESIERHIRAYYPWPGSYTFLPEHAVKNHSTGRLKVIAAEIEKECENDFCDAVPGMICAAKSAGVVVATGKGCLNLTVVHPDGSRRMDGRAFLNGHKLEKGDCLRSEVQ
ncbi:MAG: methionyl-tRNA formyltransferase [Kiritimatiellia bacterium]